jgi:adenylosuccinate synthase
MPTDPEAWPELEPVYADLPGFDVDLVAARDPEDLPEPARRVLAFIEAETGRPIELVSVGPGRAENVLFPDAVGSGVGRVAPP